MATEALRLHQERARTTEIVYRRELRPILTTGAEIMDTIDHPSAAGHAGARSSGQFQTQALQTL
jgi:hypothetical protein